MNDKKPMFSLYITWKQDYTEYQQYIEFKIEQELQKNDFKEARQLIDSIKNK
jgi:uncharacterized protein (DUF1919 family)